jgi:hypothetical protein
MPIRRNSYFNDPAFAQASENLSSMFAPPSGSEAAGWAAANAKNAEAKRLADFYALSQDETVDRNRLDRAGIGSGSYAPASSYYALDQTQATSRSNNAADNTRALEDRRLQEEGSLQRKYAEPITVAKDANVYLPGETAAATGLPSVLSGMYGASPGERLTLPDGRVIDGQAKPLSQDEFMAQQQQELRAKGQLTDEDILNAVRGKETPVQAVGADGRPVYMNPGAAVTSNAEPYIKDTTVQTDNYRDPTGKVGTAFYDEREKVWKDTQNKQPLPDGSITSSKVPTDAVGSGFGKPTEASDTDPQRLSRRFVAPKCVILDVLVSLSITKSATDVGFGQGS